MRILGLSYRQLRERLDALATVDGLLVSQVAKGSRGRLEYSPAVLQMLRDLAKVAGNEGKNLRQAAKSLSREIHGDGERERDAELADLDVKGVSLVAQVEILEHRLRDKDAVIAAKDAQISQLQSEVAFLRARVEELTPLALPRPRRRWVAWLRRAY